MSQLLEYAKREMKRAGLYEKDSDYDGEIAPCVEKMIEAFSSFGHSGGSKDLTLSIFNQVVQFKPLSSITNDPEEWMEVGTGVWQNRRNGSCFSNDRGKTYYDIDKGGSPTSRVHTTPEARK